MNFRAGNILLVEDSDDVALTLRALNRQRITDAVMVARDGQEALDYCFGLNAHAGRERAMQPPVILLGANSYVRKPIDFNQFVEAVRQSGIYWLVRSEPPSAFGDAC